MNDVTQILSQIESGDPSAAEQLLPLVYEELRNLAAAKLAHERPGQTLDATALVHEAYLRLVGPGDREEQRWDGRSHFFAAAAEAMRRILVENARRKSRLCHGGDLERAAVEIDKINLSAQPSDDDILAVHEALDALEKTDSQAAQVVKLHYFLGLSFAEIAAVQQISERTAYRTWSFARTWLFQYLAPKKP
jgi:RNA polymerase sigma factor (TIGR02999 family)